MNTIYEGVDLVELGRIMRRGVDHAGCAISPFIDREGGWPLRCCLADSAPGDRLAIVAFSNFPWTSPFCTTGPIAVHAELCGGTSGTFPAQFDHRAQIVRAYGNGSRRRHTILYDLNSLVAAGAGLARTIDRVLEDPRVEFVHTHNVLAGCYSFTARRAQITNTGRSNTALRGPSPAPTLNSDLRLCD